MKNKFITPKRSTGGLNYGFIYQVVAEADSSGYLKVLHPEMVVFEKLVPAGIHLIHKKNAKVVNRD